MKRLLVFSLLFWLLTGTAGSQVIIELVNPVNSKRTDAVVEVPWKSVIAVYPDIDTSAFRVINPTTNSQVPFQLEYYGGQEIRNLLVQVSMEAKSKLHLRITKGRSGRVAAKTYCRYVPEREDDFAWENDKIAFRTYGKALESTAGNAYGADVWVKRADKLVINDRYKGKDYHTDHGDGLDYYHVGLTLGAGDIAPYLNDSVCYSRNYRAWKILDNGPLRSTFRLTYDSWIVGNTAVNVTKTISIDAGSQLHKVEALYTADGLDVLPVAVGVIKRDQSGTILLDESHGQMGYWEPADTINGTTGVGCVFLQPVKKMISGKEQLFSLFDIRPGIPFQYFRGAAWDKAGVIQSATSWFKYLDQYKQQIQLPVKVRVLRPFR